MSFTQELPVWHATGTAVPTSLKNNGWAALMKPPAAYFNYIHNRTYLALKELQEKAALSADVTSIQTTLNSKLDTAQTKAVVKNILRSGSVLMASPGANTLISTTVTFDPPMDKAPNVFATPDSGDPRLISVSTSAVTVNGFTINYVRTNSLTNNTSVRWIAVEREG